MAILHGSWLPQQQRFFLWGEAWQRTEPASVNQVSEHPYAMERAELSAWLKTQGVCEGTDTDSHSLVLPKSLWKQLQGRSKKAAWGQVLLALPSCVDADGLLPLHSATDLETIQANVDLALFSWQVEGFWLTPEEALVLLSHLPLGQVPGEKSMVAADLRYWSHVCRWGLDLLARGKFLPGVELSSQRQAAFWQPLLDSAIDQERLRSFSLSMPAACRFYQLQAEAYPAVPLQSPPPTYLSSFLQVLVDEWVRAIAKKQPIPATATLSKELPLREWLQNLAAQDATIDANPVALSRLREALTTWTAPLQTRREDYRLCLELAPPATQGENWLLHYYLQAVAEPDWRLSAETIWQHPVEQLRWQQLTVQTPQETLLAGLGRAARLYEPIRQSLLEPNPVRCSLEPIQAYEFIKSAAWKLQDNGIGVILPPGLTEGSGQESHLGLKVRAQVPPRKTRQRLGIKSLLNFQWDLSLAGETLDQKTFEQVTSQGSPLVNVNGKWVELRPQEVRAAKKFLKKKSADTPLSVEDAIRISTGDTQMIDKLSVVSFEAEGPLQALIDTLTTGNQTLAPVDEPEGFRGQLRPYQARGVSWLSFLEQWGLGACLADDMGLGKTIQLIAFLLNLRQQGFLEAPILLICPTSVLGNWEREVHRFAPDLKTLIYHGDKRPHGKNLVKAADATQLVITSYALVHRDLKDLKQVEWQGVVLDEAQNIKNPNAKQSKAVRELDTGFRVALTGTPVENRLGELWSIMDFLNPGYLGPRNFFQRRFSTPIERYGDTASMQTLRSLVQPFILRRLKTDRDIIQDLPEKQEMTVFCQLSAEQASLYQQLVEASLVEIESAEGVQRRGQVLGLLTKLKQICNHPAQYLKEPALGIAGRSVKLQRLDEMLVELIDEGDRALIFTQFAEWGKLLQTHLKQKLRQDALFLYGSTSRTQREAMVDRFQNDPDGPRIFILSLKAGGVGLNLTRANHVFHFDRWWNPAVENQATDRAFRIGQTRNVQVHKFVCTGTLEERIHDMLESKQALSEQVVGAGENWLTELDTDQLRNLLLLDRSAIIEGG